MSNPPPQAPHDRIPAGIAAARDYESLAVAHLPAPTLAYLAGGSDRDRTLRANRAAFARHAPLPRVLRDVRAGHTRHTLLGRELAHPLLLAPLAHQRLAHPNAELDTARAAAATGTPLIAATLASRRLEDIAAAYRREGDAGLLFQLYVQPDRAATLDLLRRAEAAGYQAIVVTLDAAIQVPSRSARNAGFRMPEDMTTPNLIDAAPHAATGVGGGSRVFQGLMARAPTWADLDWLRAQTALPVIVKGVLHPDDALACRNRGVAGIVVSNHGGRGLDGVPASLDALPAVRAALGPDYPVLFDGGVRSGGDLFTALAMGADAVLIGRLQVYALAVAGALGVAHMLKLLREELELHMAMTGCATLADVRGATLIPTVSDPESTSC